MASGYYAATMEAYREANQGRIPRVLVERKITLPPQGLYLKVKPLMNTLPGLGGIVSGVSRHGTLEDIESGYSSSKPGFKFPSYLSEFFRCYSEDLTGSRDDPSEVARIFKSPIEVYLEGGRFAGAVYSISKGRKKEELCFNLFVPRGEVPLGFASNPGARANHGRELLRNFESLHPGTELVCEFLPSSGLKDIFEGGGYTISEKSFGTLEARKRSSFSIF